MSEAGGSWALRVGAVLLLVVVHVGLWRPVRDAYIEHVAYPLVEAVDTPRAARFDVRSGVRAVEADDGAKTHFYHSPANMGYLVAASVLLLAFPRRRYWLWLWLAHLVVSFVLLIIFLAGVGWSDLALVGARFGLIYVVPAVNLVALAAAFMSEHSAVFGPNPTA